MSATSSLPTVPSLSRSSIWNPSRSVLTCAGCSCERALPFPMTDGGAAAVRGIPLAAGDGRSSTARGVRLPVVVVGVELFANLEALLDCPSLEGDADGVVCRNGEGETGDSGRRRPRGGSGQVIGLLGVNAGGKRFNRDTDLLRRFNPRTRSLRTRTRTLSFLASSSRSQGSNQ